MADPTSTFPRLTPRSSIMSAPRANDSNELPDVPPEDRLTPSPSLCPGISETGMSPAPERFDVSHICSLALRANSGGVACLAAGPVAKKRGLPCFCSRSADALRAPQRLFNTTVHISVVACDSRSENSSAQDSRRWHARRPVGMHARAHKTPRGVVSWQQLWLRPPSRSAAAPTVASSTALRTTAA